MSGVCVLHVRLDGSTQRRSETPCESGQPTAVDAGRVPTHGNGSHDGQDTFSFDVSMWEVLWPLLHGRR